MNPHFFKNKILRGLDPDVVQRLELRPIPLPSGLQIEEPGDRIQRLIFLEEGIAAKTTMFSDGFEVEIGMYGIESVIGAAALFGATRSPFRVSMQMNGSGYYSPVPAALNEFANHERFRELILRATYVHLVQACQSAACNAHHEVTQRLSRWLLLCADRTEAPILFLTQGYLADMLGVARTSVNAAAEGLQREGLIQYSRGRVQITDRIGLENRACECYRAVREHFEDSLEDMRNQSLHETR